MATSFTIENIGGSVGLGTSDLRLTTIHVIQWVLGILAILAVLMFLFGAGNYLIRGKSTTVVEPVARRMMIWSLVGLVTILLAWAIVSFVAGTTANVTK